MIGFAPNITQSIKYVKPLTGMSNSPKGEFHMIGKEKNLKENIVSIRCSLSKVHVYPPEQIHD